ncbi:MJ0042-type zinc finger domain-containing protein [Bradyrhizobium sp. Tv2a-2]|uniref:MJ0042-type zinc finger domain-containing protein n=1 Tax=Bradyrhizobium sp. Tv2a-2 TaxID=113395 RepID=UPI0004105C67|nr:MJ0042-type zinc finger domain-containing protein [Bradyrhizobium sp. Tv2a-2]
MHIVCPHCTTSYAVDPATLGATGRTVRCSRCKEVWLARPEDAIAPEPAVAPHLAAASHEETDAAAEWEAMAREETGEDAPQVESPSIAGDFPADRSFSSHIDNGDWQTMGRQGADDEAEDDAGLGRSRFHRLLPQLARPKLTGRMTGLTFAGPTTACAAMGALAMALLVWRADVVRLMPQTAAFYRMVGLQVNLRGVQFRDVKITTETVEGKPVLVIEGAIVGRSRKPVDLPRLRFSVRDAQGAEIYAWNAVLDQTVLQPGERAAFKSRLASPPAEGRSIDIRFFNKRDIAGGSV